MKKRCGRCDNCVRVTKCQNEMIYALADSRTRGRSIGEDIRLIWNRTLEKNPCTDVMYDSTNGKIYFDRSGKAVFVTWTVETVVKESVMVKLLEPPKDKVVVTNLFDSESEAIEWGMKCTNHS